jgi:hypothetical protein
LRSQAVLAAGALAEEYCVALPQLLGCQVSQGGQVVGGMGFHVVVLSEGVWWLTQVDTEHDVAEELKAIWGKTERIRVCNKSG